MHPGGGQKAMCGSRCICRADVLGHHGGTGNGGSAPAEDTGGHAAGRGGGRSTVLHGISDLGRDPGLGK